mmetsp:Transcript_60351/g.155530  ORF Transcript_60351/g.155530 Transcript_60351/m.155530 type:complete len:268 (+) Transcript_60351:1008-1811(+)
MEELVCEVAVPSIYCTSSVDARVAHMLVPGAGPAVAGPPHVCNLRVGACHNLAAAEPHAQGLVQIFAAPTKHLGVVAARLEPPPPRHSEEAARDDCHVHVFGVEPLEVGVPRQVALGHAAPEALLRPGVDVQGGDLRHNHAPPVLTYQLQEVLVPARLRRDVAVEEGADVAEHGITSGLLRTDEPHCLLVPQDPKVVLLLDIWTQMRLRERWVATVVHDNDLLQNIGGRVVEDSLDRLERVVAFLSAREHHRDGLRVPSQRLNVRVH